LQTKRALVLPSINVLTVSKLISQSFSGSRSYHLISTPRLSQIGLYKGNEGEGNKILSPLLHNALIDRNRALWHPKVKNTSSAAKVCLGGNEYLSTIAYLASGDPN
jgi:hypothetical protein